MLSGSTLVIPFLNGAAMSYIPPGYTEGTAAATPSALLHPTPAAANDNKDNNGSQQGKTAEEQGCRCT